LNDLLVTKCSRSPFEDSIPSKKIMGLGYYVLLSNVIVSWLTNDVIPSAVFHF
jgi:hypothetical protein